jgi:AraC-like DNA-binding protein/ligand-binding sensor protein
MSHKTTALAQFNLKAIENPSFTFCMLHSLFRQATGLDVFLGFINQPQGEWEERTMGGPVQLPQYCRLLQDHPDGQELCVSSHRKMEEQAAQANRPLCLHCHMGLMTIHFPVSITGRGRGNFQTVCGMPRKNSNGLIDKLSKRAAALGVPAEDIEEAISSMKTINKAEAVVVAEWLEVLANYLEEQSLQGSSRGEEEQHVVRTSISNGPDIERLIRREIGSSLPLPHWRGQRCTGMTASLAERVVVFLEQHYACDLSSQVIAQALGFESSYFAKSFKKFIGRSVIALLRQIRIANARELLGNPHLSVLEIARTTGFCNASHFSRIFHQSEGLSPREWRLSQACA